MDIIRFLSKPPCTSFAPEWDWIMYEEMLEGVDFDKIAKIILEKEKEIIQTFPPSDKSSIDAYTGLGENSLTSRYGSFNVFEWPDFEIQQLKNQIYDNYLKFLQILNDENIRTVPRRKVWIQSWANVMRKGEKILHHLHSTSPYCYLGGHVTVQTEETSTIYINPINQLNDPQQHTSENRVGKLTFFQNNIPHYTTEYTGTSERITIAFDLVVDENPLVQTAKHLVLFDKI